MVIVVAALPALIVSNPLVLNVPEPVMVSLPDTPKVMPPLAVIPPPRLTLPPVVLMVKLPEPTETEDVVIRLPAAVMDSELGAPENEPKVRASEPCVTVTPPVKLRLRVATLVSTFAVPLPPFNVNAPVEFKMPLPLIVPVPLVPKVMPPFAVMVPLTVRLLPEFAVTDKVPAPKLLAFRVIDPVCVSVTEPPDVVLVSCPADVVSDVLPLPALIVKEPVVTLPLDTDITPLPVVVSVTLPSEELPDETEPLTVIPLPFVSVRVIVVAPVSLMLATDTPCPLIAIVPPPVPDIVPLPPPNCPPALAVKFCPFIDKLLPLLTKMFALFSRSKLYNPAVVPAVPDGMLIEPLTAMPPPSDDEPITTLPAVIPKRTDGVTLKDPPLEPTTIPSAVFGRSVTVPVPTFTVVSKPMLDWLISPVVKVRFADPLATASEVGSEKVPAFIVTAEPLAMVTVLLPVKPNCPVDPALKVGAPNNSMLAPCRVRKFPEPVPTSVPVPPTARLFAPLFPD